MWCGTEDFLFVDNELFANHLTDLGIRFTFTKSSGDHQWQYWDEQIQNVLKWLPLRHKDDK
jgi:putative tributyrin esterase